MPRKRKLSNTNELDLIFEELSPNFEIIYKELLSKLREMPNYKRLKRAGEGLFLNPHECADLKYSYTRLSMVKSCLLSTELLDNIDELIQQKFQASFLNELKNEVLKTILKLYSEDGASTTNATSDVLHKDDILEKLQEISKSGAESLNIITKEIFNLPHEDLNTTETLSEESPILIELDSGKIKIENRRLSFSSLSSVHTSDLSSYDDEIVFSSDEEFDGDQKRISLKDAIEKVKELQRAKEEREKKSTKSDHLEVTPQVSLHGRVRKPNSKYKNEITDTTILNKLCL